MSSAGSVGMARPSRRPLVRLAVKYAPTPIIDTVAKERSPPMPSMTERPRAAMKLMTATFITIML